MIILTYMLCLAKSPVFTHLNATIQGITTIRAFGVQQLLMNEFDDYQNKHTSAYYTFVSCDRTLGFWIDVFASVYIIAVTYSFLLLGDGLFSDSYNAINGQFYHFFFL